MVAAATRALWGVDLFAWQQHVMDVVHERDPDTGRHVYDTVVLVVGRRAGKSVGALAQDWTFCARPGWWRPGMRTFRSAYTAQNLVGATKRLGETWDMFSETSSPAMRAQARHLRGVVHAAVEFRWKGAGRDLNPSRSRVSVFAPTRHGLRGDSYAVVKIDEVTALSAAEGEALSDAVRPTLADQDGQLWLMSNLALEDGGYLPQLMQRGRESVDSGRTDGLAYFEWSAPDGSDVTDPLVWRDAHPAVGDVLTETRLRRELEEMGPTRFAAEYLNMPSAAGSMLTPELFASVLGDAGSPSGARVWLGVDVTPDRLHGSVALAWNRGGRVRGGVLWTGPAVDLPAVVEEQATELDARVMYDPVVSGAFARPGWTKVTASAYAEACARFVDLARSRGLVLRPDPALARAAGAVGTRRLGDGWAWTRRGSPTDISPLVAVTLAAFGARTVDDPVLV